MKYEKLNNTDRWLIEHWEKLHQMENAMAGTRQRFESLFHAIHKKVKHTHPALDRMDIHFSQRELKNDGGSVIFSKGSWPSTWSEAWRTGFYVWGITLEQLAFESNDGPSMGIYFPVNKSDRRIEKFRQRINEAAPRFLKNQKISEPIRDEDDTRTLLWYRMPEGQKKLLEMLCGGKEQAFIDCIARHVGILSSFIPVLDKLLK